MIELLKALSSLAFLLFQQWFKFNDEKKKDREAKMKEIKDVIKTGDTSTITAALSRM